jgi:hypothetical protein
VGNGSAEFPERYCWICEISQPGLALGVC